MGAADGYRKYYWGLSKERRQEYIKKKSLQNKNRKHCSEKRLAYNKSDRGVYNGYMNECRRRGRLARGILFEISFDDFCQLINSNCTYCGAENCRGVDRVDSSKSYTVENSVACCSTCNRMKLDHSLDGFKEHLKKIVKHLKLD